MLLRSLEATPLKRGANSSNLAPRDGFEPPTNGLTVRRSTTELPGNSEKARIVGKPRTEVKKSGVRRWRGTRRALPSSRYNLNFCISCEGELDCVVSHVARPAGHEIIEPLVIVREQGARSLLEVRQIAGHGRHEVIGCLLSLPPLIRLLVCPPRRIDQLTDRDRCAAGL